MIITVGPRDFLKGFFYTHDIKKKTISTRQKRRHVVRFFFSSSGWQRGLVHDHRRLGRHRLDHRRRGCRRA